MHAVNIEKTISTKVATFKLRSDGIVVQEIKEGVNILEEDALEQIEAHKKLTPDRSPLMILHTSNYSVSHEAQLVFAGDNFPLALGIITKTSAARITINLIFRVFDILKKKNIPKKLFSDEEEAVKWLRKFVVTRKFL